MIDPFFRMPLRIIASLIYIDTFLSVSPDICSFILNDINNFSVIFDISTDWLFSFSQLYVCTLVVSFLIFLISPEKSYTVLDHIHVNIELCMGLPYKGHL